MATRSPLSQPVRGNVFPTFQMAPRLNAQDQALADRYPLGIISDAIVTPGEQLREYPRYLKALELRLAALNREIHELRAQQRVIVDLLKNPRLSGTGRVYLSEYG